MKNNNIIENKSKTPSSLLHRYIDNLYTQEDVHKLHRRLKETPMNEDFDELAKEIWEESELQENHTSREEHEQYKKEARMLLEKMGNKKKSKYRKLYFAVTGIAAMICIILGGMNLYRFMDKQQIVYQEICTSYGEHREICLPDGTALVLNSCSRVRFPEYFAGKERRVELDGEGYFRVKRDESSPFIVQTHSFDVRVLGTCFNIKSYLSDEIVSVNVESGKVQVDLPEAMMRLQANEQILINKVSGTYSKLNEKHEVAIWRKGNLCFNATPIHDVAKELERMYNCRIVFAEGQEFQNLISGEHDNKSLEAVLQSIEYTSGIHYRISGNQVFLFKK